jgi:hypothetical protein
MDDCQYVDLLLPNPVDDPIRSFDDFAAVRPAILRYYPS